MPVQRAARHGSHAGVWELKFQSWSLIARSKGAESNSVISSDLGVLLRKPQRD